MQLTIGLTISLPKLLRSTVSINHKSPCSEKVQIVESDEGLQGGSPGNVAELNFFILNVSLRTGQVCFIFFFISNLQEKSSQFINFNSQKVKNFRKSLSILVVHEEKDLQGLKRVIERNYGLKIP